MSLKTKDREVFEAIVREKERQQNNLEMIASENYTSPAVIEAMGSHRPYRPGLGIQPALDEIERGKGTLYDTNVADACLRLFREKGYSLPA